MAEKIIVHTKQTPLTVKPKWTPASSSLIGILKVHMYIDHYEYKEY